MKTLFIIVFGILINISAYANFKVNGTLNDECDFLKNKIERLLYNADFDQKEEDKKFKRTELYFLLALNISFFWVFFCLINNPKSIKIKPLNKLPFKTQFYNILFY